MHGSCYISLFKFKSFDKFNPPLRTASNFTHLLSCGTIVILTKPACHHNSFWVSRYDSNQAHTISLKPCIISRRFRLTSFDTAHFITTILFITSNGPPKSISRRFRLYFLKFNTFRLIPAKTNFSRLPSLKISQKVQITSITQICGTV